MTSREPTLTLFDVPGAARDYYKGGKRVMRDGAPCEVASWVGELGNDKEFIEATRPRTEYKKAYYEGGYRMIFDGVPCRLSAHVKDWAPWMRRALGRGYMPRGIGEDVDFRATAAQRLNSNDSGTF